MLRINSKWFGCVCNMPEWTQKLHRDHKTVVSFFLTLSLSDVFDLLWKCVFLSCKTAKPNTSCFDSTWMLNVTIANVDVRSDCDVFILITTGCLWVKRKSIYLLLKAVACAGIWPASARMHGKGSRTCLFKNGWTLFHSEVAKSKMPRAGVVIFVAPGSLPAHWSLPWWTRG